MAFMDAKNLASLKLKPIKKTFKKYPTLLKNKNLFCLCGLKDFVWENVYYKH
jgi:hypothetical protein